ncbi:DUF4935 domain-containing protein [Tenacibaculum finnmarkense genomovar ulcerans]|nr:DUF4935 domain-containing protein [Tenacibaculum finnmarkense genomovar ulcerans]
MDEPKGIFNELKGFIESNEIHILSNSIIADEWMRNKETTIKNVISKIQKQSKSALEIKEYLPENERIELENILEKYKTNEKNRIEIVLSRIDDIEQMINQATQTKITDEMKLKVVDWALEKKAPFALKTNSVGDALIILSAVEHRKKNMNKGFYPKGYFVSWNHTDYADLNDKDLIHPDLKDMLENANLHYHRYIGLALKLAPEHLMEIENYIDMSIEIAKDQRRGM